MGTLPHLKFAPCWEAVRSAVAGLEVPRRIEAARSTLATAWQSARALDRAKLETAARTGLASGRQAASTYWPLLREIADPRGRCNRKAFLTIALAFLAIQFAVAGVFWLGGIETSPTTSLLLNAPILWIGSTVCFKRLHDVGRSGWWLPGSFAIWLVAALVSLALISLVLSEDALDPGQTPFYLAFLAITLPVFGALLWLHTAPSVPTENKYGPVAGPNGLSMPAPKAQGPHAAEAVPAA